MRRSHEVQTRLFSVNVTNPVVDKAGWCIPTVVPEPDFAEEDVTLVLDGIAPVIPKDYAVTAAGEDKKLMDWHLKNLGISL
jgi:hypothetical protein